MAAAAIPALINAGLGIWSSIRNSHAIGAAANARTGSYDDAIKLFLENLGINNSYLTNAAQQGIQWGNDATNSAQENLGDKTNQAVTHLDQTTKGANSTYLDPYVQPGIDANAKLGDLANEQFTFSPTDPSYQFRLQEGQKALERSAIARGGGLGGGTAKALARYGQNMASTEYGAAFDRFQRDRTNRGLILSDLATRGLTAGTIAGRNVIDASKTGGQWTQDTAKTTGNWGIDNAQFASKLNYGSASDVVNNNNSTFRNVADLYLGRGNSIASGVMGQAGASNQMFSNIGGAVSTLGGWLGSLNKNRGSGKGGIYDANGTYIGE